MKTIDRRRRGATAYAPQMGTIGPGWLPLDDCWLNWVRVFVPLSETSGRTYAIRPYPDGQKTGTGGVGAMPIFYPSDHPSTIVRPEERHRSPSARKDELQGRARKSECPKRSVATQVFRISASAARLSAWVTVALTFFCLLFLCQDKKRRWGPVGASPHPLADEGQGPDDFPIHIDIGMWGPVGASPHPMTDEE